MKKTITIKDVAKDAKVSFKTVSRVINNEKGVSKKTSDQVKRSVRKLQFVPNLNAKAIRTKISHTIGFVTDQIATTPYAVDIIKGAQNEASKHNKILIVINTGINDMFKNNSINMLNQRHVDGIIFAAMYHKQVNIPVETVMKSKAILVNCFDKFHHLQSIVPDDFKGGYDATKKLINAGHKKIALLNLPNQSIAAKLRQDGYIKCLNDHDIEINDEFIRQAVTRFHNREENYSYKFTRDLLRLKNAPTAFFCANDRIAIKAYDGIKSMGLNIPQDIAVIGFDNQQIICENIHPSLSSMALPHFEMGKQAVKILLNGELNNQHEHKQILMNCGYVPRNSI